MPSRYEWATIAGPTADIVDADELRDIADDPTEFTDQTIGVRTMTGSDGVMLCGDRAKIIQWADNLAIRLRRGEGMPAMDAEEAPLALSPAQRAIGTNAQRARADRPALDIEGSAQSFTTPPTVQPPPQGLVTP